jgi:hypothetical protein
MSILSWVRRFSSMHSRASSRRARRKGVAPRLEALEDRTLPSATIWYVNGAATGSNSGQSWANAFTDLQSALKEAQSGDQIWVAKGTYKPTSGSDRTISFVLDAGVAVYGGFAGTETQLSQRDWVHDVSTLSGYIGTIGTSSANSEHVISNSVSRAITGRPPVITSGSAPPSLTNSDNSYHVVTSSGLDASAILDGFTVTGGNANGPTLAMQAGGGMYNDSSSPTLANLIFSGNSVGHFDLSAASLRDGRGGGIYNENSSPTLTNITFSNNFAFLYGGGIDNNSSSPTLTNVTFSGNSASVGGGIRNDFSSPTLTNVSFSGNGATYGGGMANLSSTPTLTSVTFSGNSADADGAGGGMYNNSSSPMLTNVTFRGNIASSNSGGGMYNDASSPALTNVTFSGNIAEIGNGGGMYNEKNSTARLTNVTFSGNSADDGGGMYNDSSSPMLTNVTFSGNGAAYNGFIGAGTGDGGGMYNESSSPTLTNVTFSGNGARVGGGMYNDRSSPTLINTIVAGNSAASSPDIVGAFTDLGHNLLGTALRGVAQGSGDVFSNTPLLAPLGNYGGPTQTRALLPGSPAIGAGVAIPGITTDQRGSSLPTSNPDIGAFESHGFTLTLVSGSNQTASRNTAFAAPLVVRVTSNDSLEPVAGGVVTFTLPASGASARLRTVTAVIGSHGTASARATANGVFGSYAVTASSRGASGTVSFELSNGTVAQQVHALIVYIQSLITRKHLRQSTGTSLTAYLKQIKGTTGISLIQTFISTVQTDVAQGTVSQAIGNILIGDANAILARLTS